MNQFKYDNIVTNTKNLHFLQTSYELISTEDLQTNLVVYIFNESIFRQSKVFKSFYTVANSLSQTTNLCEIVLFLKDGLKSLFLNIHIY